ncbi:MAG TPA: phosphoribosylanthranilate isomerase [Steroidobacteraceae bacterium]|jgi:phosphoribosylanthranilate isomerase|nr:phosphoribosylanthranilate isomerase [Steroidobacteraceae bacterium]
MWIKICGITTPEAVAAALAARVDAIGFVFADSPRQLTLEDAVALAEPARGRVRCVAVTRQPSQRHLEGVLAKFRPDVLQTDAEDLRVLRLPKQLELLPVYRGCDPAQGTSRVPPGLLPARLLFEGLISGTGTPCDWTAAQRVARRTQLVLAGGLDADNVGSAIATVRPFGVDVSSGVEERPGVKSPAEVARFAAAARNAFEMIQQEQQSA